ncbi:MAG: flagellar hook-basal body complex protein FliE [Vibrio sp.]
MDVSQIGSIEHAMLNRLQFHHQIAAQPIQENTLQSTSPLAFSNALKGVLDNVNAFQADSEKKITAVELGQSTDLIGATVAAQKAQLSFSALMQVRNKMVSNFNDIIKMPI